MQRFPVTPSLRLLRSIVRARPSLLLVFIGSVLMRNIDCPSALGQSTQPLQHLWEVQPDLGDIWSLPSALPSPPIDLERLASPHAQERIDTARLISLHCDRPGFPNRDQAIEKLLAAINRPEQSTLVRRAILSAAFAVDDGTHDGVFWMRSREDPDMKIRIQRDLIRWKSKIAIDHWREVVRNPHSPSASVRLALEGLGVVGTSDDQMMLQELLESEETPNEYRWLASTALGTLRNSGLTPLARKYVDSEFIDRDLIAVALLNHHRDDEDARIVTQVLETGRSPAKRLAATWLTTHAPQIALDQIDSWSTDPDAHFRHLAIRLTAASPTSRGINIASGLLSDEDASIRLAARRAILKFALTDRDAVDASIAPLWQGSDPRSLVQAILIDVELGDASRCSRLVELLEHPDPEVRMHAAWALRDLALTVPILDQIFAKAAKMTDTLENGTADLDKSEIIKLSFLLESFGRHRYEPAYNMLTKYIPRNGFRMQNLTRASAIWSIGQLKKDIDDPSLRAELQDRITDTPPNNPENFLVRFACMLALGEFGFRDNLDMIIPLADAPPNPLVRAAQWAKDRIENSGK
jgi:hypothetical protein